MLPDELEAKLTAYALDDPSLPQAERDLITLRLQDDVEAKRFVDETKLLAGSLTTALASELATVKPSIVTPSLLVPPVKSNGSFLKLSVLAASVIFVVGAGMFAIQTMGSNSSGTFNFVTSKKAGAYEKGSHHEASSLDTIDSKPIPKFESGNLKYQDASSVAPARGGGGFAGGMPGGVPGGMNGGIGGGGMPGAKGPDGRFGTPTVESPPMGGGPGMGGPAPSGGEAAKAKPGDAPTAPGQPPMNSSRPPVWGPISIGGGGRPAGGGQPGSSAPPGAVGSGQLPREGLPDAKDFQARRGDATKEMKSLDDNLRDEKRAYKQPDPTGQDRFVADIENPFIKVEGQNALSTFGVDVDTASYSIIRKMLNDGMVPPAAAVRLEEMVNYFPYQDKAPDGNDPYRVSVELAECPWQPRHTLARIALKAKPIERDKRPPSNLVFLIDVSGSMDEPNRLPWVKRSLTMLVDQLGENDRISIVVYAGASGVVLDSTSAVNKSTILGALDKLHAGGSTNGGSGIQLAYAIAEKNFVKNGTNRVILCTDGDWNVGTTSTDDLIKLIEEKRQTNVFLSVLGFGMGNLRDEMMVKLANKGNGNYAYIDTLNEARKVLVEQISGTLVTVAKDVKIQIEFNPGRVQSYRLLGYEKRALAAKDFADDRKDAGEMGAGHVVTAFYELVPAGGVVVPGEEKLKYQAVPEVIDQKAKVENPEAMTVKLRHKLPTEDKSVLKEIPVADSRKAFGEASEDFRFGAAVATFAMVMRESPHKGNGTLVQAIEWALGAKSFDPNGYRSEFVDMLRRAKQITGKP